MNIYPKLAANAIRSNRQLYIPYILMSSGIIAVFYIMASLSQSETIKACKGGHSLVEILRYSIYIIAFFALLFMFFTNSFVIKRRTKELGLYNILGMNKKNIAGVMIFETLIMYLVSLVAGSAFGIIFSKLAEAGLVKLTKSENHLDFTISGYALKLSALVFLAIFFLIFLNSVRVVSFSNPAQMIRAESFGEKPPRANIVLGILGVAAIAFSYYLVLSMDSYKPDKVISNFAIAVIPVIAGTYLLFIAGSVLLCKILQKNNRYYYNKKHFVAVSNLAFRMKRSGAGLATIAVLTSMVLIMLTSTLAFYAQIDSVIRSDYPRENVFMGTFSFSNDSKRISLSDADRKTTELADRTEGGDMVSYAKLNFVANGRDGKYKITDKDERYCTFEEGDTVFSIISVDTYNRITGQNIDLQSGEALISPVSKNGYYADTLSFGDGKEYKVKKIGFDLFSHGRYYLNNYLVVLSDVSSYDQYASGVTCFIMFNGEKSLKQMMSFGKDAIAIYKGDEKEGEIPYHATFESDTRGSVEEQYISIYSGLIFLGVMLTILFLGATILLMYYRQVFEGHEDYGKYRILRNVGMSRKDIKATVNSLTFVTFLSPILLAIVHTSIAMYFVYQFMIMQGMFDTKRLIITAAAVYMIFALIYFIFHKLTSRTYLKIVGE